MTPGERAERLGRVVEIVREWHVERGILNDGILQERLIVAALAVEKAVREEIAEMLDAEAARAESVVKHPDINSASPTYWSHVGSMEASRNMAKRIRRPTP